MKNDHQDANGALVNGPPITAAALRRYAAELNTMADLVEMDEAASKVLVLSGFAITTSGGLPASAAQMAPGEIILSIRLDTRTNFNRHNAHG